ncbi:MAG: N-acetylmuramoyl-L-alanine amidase [Microcystaceae cyanobacterium]
MRFHWLLLSLLNILLWASPADAGRLLFWRYEPNQSRLLFTTDERVQPRAQLIPNPTRIVIDLPGVVLGRPSTEQSVGGIIRSVRVGQFNSSTTRLVIELAAGYTVNPQAVKVRGISPTQWTVTLPNPERVPPSQRNSPSSPNQQTTPPPQSRTSRSSSRTASSGGSSSSDVRITNNGIFVRLDKNGDKNKVRVEKSDRNQTVEINLPGAELPSSLANKTLAINEYGIEQIEFEQVEDRQKGVRMTLKVARNSPDWQAVYSRFDGVVLLPRGGFQGLERSGSQPRSLTSTVSPTPNITTINAVSLTNNNRQLLINGNGNLEGSGQWNSRSGVYEIRIKDAQLAENVQGPQLGNNSPIYQLRVRQEVGNTVVILVQPSLGVRFGNLSRLNRQQLALDVSSVSSRTARPTLPSRISSNNRPQTILVPPAPRDPNASTSRTPRSTTPRRQQGKVLVIIDPGHGGKDPGAIGLQGLREKDVILPISQEVARILEKQGVQVIMTRKSDYFVSLKGRTDMANRVGADLFVSIHANAVGKGRTDVNGFEIFYYGNRSLSESIHRSVTRSINIRDRGVKRARFYVLRNSRMPATLVEVGFLTGYEDSAKLRNASFRSQMAQAIARGILEHIQRNRL